MSFASPGRLGAALLACAVAGTLGLAPVPAEATKRESHAKMKSHRVKFDKGTGETTRERERRLARECRGRPNAGLCAGFGQ